MNITLCMVVKNELSNLVDGLANIRNHFADIIVVDTGSTDGTQQYLRDQHGIIPIQAQIDPRTAHSKSPLRNFAISRAKTEWIFSLDADERISPDSLEFLSSFCPSPDDAGFFGLWRNHILGTPVFDDYKLFLFRRVFRMRGLVHENVQIDIRESKRQAAWLDGLVVDHFPNPELHKYKTEFYKQRLKQAIAIEPEWIRCHWFLGYMHYEHGDNKQALSYLRTAFYSEHPLFPVERLNSGMIIVAIFASMGNHKETERALGQLAALYNSVEGDFEVIVNQYIREWLEQSTTFMQKNQIGKIACKRFAR